eukprot:CAMPEP_0198269014 /NCGR_PEP_ID=MMETSP1447-20131203/39659_1 /TAXON_ID=420782 /ORGANISM="Chaetoceros dichaeta, Strain CCMP1751" /LENGTH=171 /DNA_ID=CAMNT_0043960365 /DNA_START=24 /DNA_END=536 /DNA_ORIENTATION=+
MIGENDPSQWDRLAQTATILSSTRKRTKKEIIIHSVTLQTPPKTTTHSFFDTLSKTETFASAKSKGKTTPLIKNSFKLKEATPHIVSKRKSAYPPETTTHFFFGKLSYAKTFASATSKVKTNPPTKNSFKMKGELPNIVAEKRSASPTKTTTNSFFDRLSKAETFATARSK